MKVKIINGEYKGTIVNVYYHYENGIDFIGKHGLVFIKKEDYIIC
jgi:hypothetical protein